MKRILSYLLIIIALLGILDAGYLTWEHYRGVIPPCGVGSGIFNDCGKVLTSVYATPFGIPLALVGLLFYIAEYALIVFALFKNGRLGRILVVISSTIGLLMSIGFVYLQIGVIGALCRYCMASAFISFLFFLGVQFVYDRDRKRVIAWLLHVFYSKLGKPFFFMIDPEVIHVRMVRMGRFFGSIPLMHAFMEWCLAVDDPRLSQTVAGIRFENPVGLAAGFDYEADLTTILGHIGFGYQTVGTITNHAYEGNPSPRLGRLPISRSLMVNKGFKNLGAKATADKISGIPFSVPIGVSIGVTNSAKITSLPSAIHDCILTLKTFESSRVQHAYYELNISCPNLFTKVNFYEPKNLDTLLKEVQKLKLSRPVFIKMPIEKTEKEYKSMLEVIIRNHIPGVIIGNLSKDRKNPAIHKSEVNTYAVGNFSGKPTWDSSNSLISYTYKYYKEKLVIIGCGGIFSAADAYEKIKRGATLVQLITGMIYEGPELSSLINNGILDLLDRDGYTTIAQAIGTKKDK